MGSDSFIGAIKEGLFEETSFSNFTFALAMSAFFYSLLNYFVVTDVDDIGGFFGKAVALTKGIIYKKTNYGHIIIQLIYVSILFLGYFSGGLKGSTTAIVLLSLVLINLVIPIVLLCLLDPERLKSIVGEPSEIEKKLSNKGVDMEW